MIASKRPVKNCGVELIDIDVLGGPDDIVKQNTNVVGFHDSQINKIGEQQE